MAARRRWFPLAFLASSACGCMAMRTPCLDCIPPQIEGPTEVVRQVPIDRAPVQNSPAKAASRLVSTQTTVGNRSSSGKIIMSRQAALLPDPSRRLESEIESQPPIEQPYPIDLPTALRLADASNPQVAVAREQIRQAYAKVDTANTLWLPSIRGGINYNRHDGSIQQVDGTQFNTARAAFYTGLGAGIYGSGTPILPGVYANFSLADAYFQPLAAKQFACSRRKAAAAVTNDTLLNVAQTYLELLRASQDMAIAQEIAYHTARVAGLTSEYAKTGEGLQADADRLHVELTVRKNDVLRADESRQVAATRLAQLLHIDPTTELAPIEPTVVAVELVPANTELRELVAQGLAARPELAESRCLATEAISRLRRERFAPLVPSVLLGTSYGAMGGGLSNMMAPATARLDFDAIAYWQLRGIGLGDRAAQDEAHSVAKQAQLRQVAMMDQVAREITEAYAQSQARRRQIAIARDCVQAAVNSHRRNLERIEQAKGLPIEVMQSVQALAVARREYLRTLIDYNVAQFTLYRAIGWPAAS